MAPGPETTSLRNAALSELRHNLRTQAKQVLGYTEMLIEDAADARNARALDALRPVHSAAKAALDDINEALGSRESVTADQMEALCGSIRPRVERITHCISALRADTEAAHPADWTEDLQRIEVAAQAMIRLLGSAAAGGEPAPAVRAAAVAQTGPRLLVVDDNSTNRYRLRRRLERQGYLVEEARNGNEALDRIATESFDLVLLDLIMPVMDGFEVLEQMKKDRRMRETPVIVVSDLDETDSIGRAIELGADDYLLKPFDPVLLRARIGALLQTKRLANELAAQTKQASLTALTAGIAHEIRRPLEIVMSQARLSAQIAADLRRLLPVSEGRISAEKRAELRQLSDCMVETVAEIRDHCARIDGIIGSIVAHSSGQEQERRPVDVNQLVKQYVALACHGEGAQDAAISPETDGDYDPEAGVVYGAPQDLGRAFLNIASNALDSLRRKVHEKHGHGYRPELKIMTRAFKDRVEVRIRDNGAGIPKKVRDRIFDPFFTAEAFCEGTGLGLAISHEIVVQEHQGDMRVESQEGEYTEFLISIPRAAA